MLAGSRNSNSGENGSLRGYLHHFYGWYSCSSQSICQLWDTLTWSDIGPCWFMSRHSVTKGRCWHYQHFSVRVEFEIGMETGLNTEQVEGRGWGGLYRSRFIMDMHTWIGYSIQTRLECQVWHGASGSVKQLCFVRIQFNWNLYLLLIRNHTNIIRGILHSDTNVIVSAKTSHPLWILYSWGPTYSTFPLSSYSAQL